MARSRRWRWGAARPGSIVTIDAPLDAAVIGAGPAGLMAAEMIADAGRRVAVFEAMPSPARKFLMAGKSGLNITHVASDADLAAVYPNAPQRLLQAVTDFGPSRIQDWMAQLGVQPLTGPTGRVFPEQMKASPLLRAWLARLESKGVELHTRHHWIGWEESGELIFLTPNGQRNIPCRAQIFTLGGASWKRLGSDGSWLPAFETLGVPVSPFRPSNCGLRVNWSDRMQAEFAGAPVKNVAVRFEDQSSREEFVITSRGMESGAVFTLSLSVRDALERAGGATIHLDLLPDVSAEDVRHRLSRPRGKQSLSNHLRKTLNLAGVKRALLFEFGGLEAAEAPDQLARLIKHLPVPVIGLFPLDEAISTDGGISFEALDDHFMLKHRPGRFSAGEMLDWDAPTGGYLLTACLATGRAAGRGAVRWLNNAENT